MLLFKNGFRKFVRDYIQFTIFVLLVFMGSIFTLTFGISSSNLVRTKNLVTENYTPFDYSFRYTSSGYDSNDVQTLDPWFAFDMEVLSANKTNYSTLTIGENGALRPYEFNVEQNSSGNFTYNSSIYQISNAYYVNFGFGETELIKTSEAQKKSYRPNDDRAVIKYDTAKKVEVVKSGEFGRFYRFNFTNENFKKSLIGKLYAKYDNFAGDLSVEAIDTALSIYDYMFYLNNSAITSMLRATIAQIYTNVLSSTSGETAIKAAVEAKINYQSEENTPTSEEQITSNGYNGRFGYVFSSASDDETNTLEKTTYFLFASENSNTFQSGASTQNENRLQILRNGTYLMKDFESRNLFWNPEVQAGGLLNQKNLTARYLFEAYFKTLGKLTNFEVELTSEIVTWNSDGQKFRIISAFHTENIDNTNQTFFYNEDSYTMFKTFDSPDALTGRSFMASNGWVQKNGWQLGQEYAIIPGYDEQYRLDAVGTDYYNIYPTIYEEDLLTDQQNEAIFYVNSQIFEKYFTHNLKDGILLFDNSKFQDVSRTYLRHTGNKALLSEDAKNYGLYIGDNMVTIGEAIKAITNNNYNKDITYSRADLQTREDTNILAFRSELISSISNLFLGISITFCIVFVLCIVFMIYTITRKVMISQRGQIGNLKSLGYSNVKVLMNYVLYMIIPTFLIIPFGWAASLFLQRPIMLIFESYFNIPVLFSIDWKILLIVWFAFTFINAMVVGIVAWSTIIKKPLELMAPSKSTQPNLLLTRLISKFKYINFTSKLRMILISTSIRGLATFFSVITLSSFVLMISSVLPSSMDKMKTEYFSRIHYNNDYLYKNAISNNPLTITPFYNLTSDLEQSNLQASNFSSYIKSGDQYISLLDDASEWNNQNSSYLQMFENIIYNNITSFKGATVSVGTLDSLITKANQINSITGASVKTAINAFSCQVLPTLFNQELIEGSNNNYADCIKAISNNIVPSTIKQMWDKDDTTFKNFSFNFGTIPYNENEDEVYTQIMGKDDQTRQEIVGYGLDLTRENHKLDFDNLEQIKYDADLDYIPVLMNEKMRIRGYNVNQEFKLKITTEKLAAKGVEDSSDDILINNSDWAYKDEDGSDVDLTTIDQSRFSYFRSDLIGHENENDYSFYYKDSAGNYQKYYNLANVQLKINTNKLNQKLLAEVNTEYQNYSGLDLTSQIDPSTGQLIVNPFDVYTYEEGKPKAIDIIQFAAGGTNSWMNIALKKGLFITKNVDNYSKPLKIVGVEKLYSGNRVYMDQIYANELLGYQNPTQRQTLTNGTTVNIYSNAKMSSNSTIADHYDRYLLTPINMNNTTDGFGMYMKATISSTDFVQMNQEAIQKLIDSTLAIIIILIIICVVTSIIIIYLMTDMFVGRYKTFMSYMRIQGYYMKEINSVVMWIYLPLTILGALLGIGIMLLVTFAIIPQVLLALNIAVRFIMNWWIIGLVMLLVIAIFAVSYGTILKSLSRVQLTKMIG